MSSSNLYHGCLHCIKNSREIQLMNEKLLLYFPQNVDVLSKKNNNSNNSSTSSEPDQVLDSLAKQAWIWFDSSNKIVPDVQDLLEQFQNKKGLVLTLKEIFILLAGVSEIFRFIARFKIPLSQNLNIELSKEIPVVLSHSICKILKQNQNQISLGLINTRSETPEFPPKLKRMRWRCDVIISSISSLTNPSSSGKRKMKTVLKPQITLQLELSDGTTKVICINSMDVFHELRFNVAKSLETMLRTIPNHPMIKIIENIEKSRSIAR